MARPPSPSSKYIKGSDTFDDPFDCFDDSDDEDDVQGSAETIDACTINALAASGFVRDGGDAIFCNDLAKGRRKVARPVLRDPTCGVLAFHPGTEVALLHHVKMQHDGIVTEDDDGDDGGNEINTSSQSSQSSKRAAKVLTWIDDFCLQRHWMMHIGKEKGDILKDFILECVSSRKTDKVSFVELGTYCGYSAIFMAKTLLDYFGDKAPSPTSSTSSSTPFRFTIWSVEVVEHHATVAQELIRLSGMEPYIQIVLLDPEDVDGIALLTALQSRIVATDEPSSTDQVVGADATTTANIDFLFIDHDKDLYLQDLQLLEAAGMIRAGSFVAADNVVFAKIDSYRQYMQDLSRQRIVQTRTAESLVEYSQPELADAIKDGGAPLSSEEARSMATHRDFLKDGIELSVYLRDPLVIPSKP